MHDDKSIPVTLYIKPSTVEALHKAARASDQSASRYVRHVLGKALIADGFCQADAKASVAPQTHERG